MATKRRYPVWEITLFELEHNYALHPSLEAKNNKEQICINKHVLLRETPQKEIDDDLIDVESAPALAKSSYNNLKVKQHFEEIERHSRRICYGNETNDEAQPTEEEAEKLEAFISRVRLKLSEDGSDSRRERNQERIMLFNKTLNLLNDLYLLFLSIKNTNNEALKRRISIDKSAAKLRRMFSSVGYKSQNIQWLHEQLTQMLPWYLLAPYLDVLCSLRSKIPNLMNHSLEPLLSQCDSKVARALAYTTRKPWDPINSSHMNILKQKLGHSNQPIICYVPTRSVLPRSAPQMKRMRFWNTQLSSFGKIQNINYQNIPADGDLGDTVDKMITTTRLQVNDMHKRNPNKPIILVGWDNAALISLIVSILEPECVTSVCCLGFPLVSLQGYRGNNIDPLLDIQCPVFIAIGSNAANSDVKEIDDMRDQMRVQSKMIVVEGGDSLLRVPTETQLKVGETQSMIDKHVIDDMWEFLYTIISGKYSKINDLSALGQTDVDVEEKRTKLCRTPSHPKKNIKEYTAYLREKIKIMGRMPTPEENKKFFAEFSKLKGLKGIKRRKEDLHPDTPGKRLKTMSIEESSPATPHVTQLEQKQARNDELESATQNLERLLDE